MIVGPVGLEEFDSIAGVPTDDGYQVVPPEMTVQSEIVEKRVWRGELTPI